jgi:hypothetical protein
LRADRPAASYAGVFAPEAAAEVMAIAAWWRRTLQRPRRPSATTVADSILLVVRTARAKVVNGKIVTRARFSTRTKLFLVMDEPPAEVEIENDDEKAFNETMACVRRGERFHSRRSARSRSASDPIRPVSSAVR